MFDSSFESKNVEYYIHKVAQYISREASNLELVALLLKAGFNEFEIKLIIEAAKILAKDWFEEEELPTKPDNIRRIIK